MRSRIQPWISGYRFGGDARSANGALNEENAMSKMSAKIKEESLAVIPPTIFFFVALHIVAFVRALMVKATGIAPLSTVSIAVAALILGKAVLIADMLPISNRFPEKPLIYNVVWKTLIYVLVSALIHYLEHLVDYWRQARPGGWQREAVGGNRVATFLGGSDHFVGAHCDVLHDARTGARDREGQGTKDLLRTAPRPGGLSCAEFSVNAIGQPLTFV